MLNAYRTGVSFGTFTAGALIGGGLAFIVFAFKKRWGAAFLSLLACGAISFLHPIASVVTGVIALIIAIVSKNER